MELIRMANMSANGQGFNGCFYHSNLKNTPGFTDGRAGRWPGKRDQCLFTGAVAAFLNHQQSKIISGVMSAANDLERISDHACNIAYLSEMVIEDKLPVTPKAKEEIFSFFEEVDGMLGEAIMALMGENIRVARGVIKRDNVVDERERILRRNHIDRVNRRECLPRAGVVYLDILSNLERVGDHAVNLAQMITGEF